MSAPDNYDPVEAAATLLPYWRLSQAMTFEFKGHPAVLGEISRGKKVPEKACLKISQTQEKREKGGHIIQAKF
jgi:hypothetical protein